MLSDQSLAFSSPQGSSGCEFSTRKIDAAEARTPAQLGDVLQHLIRAPLVAVVLVEVCGAPLEEVGPLEAQPGRQEALGCTTGLCQDRARVVLEPAGVAAAEVAHNVALLQPQRNVHLAACGCVCRKPICV